MQERVNQMPEQAASQTISLNDAATLSQNYLVSDRKNDVKARVKAHAKRKRPKAKESSGPPRKV